VVLTDVNKVRAVDQIVSGRSGIDALEAELQSLSSDVRSRPALSMQEIGENLRKFDANERDIRAFLNDTEPSSTLHQ
jgi:hypothetical protein